MGHVTLTIAEIRRPAEGKDRGNIIGTDGTKLGCFREKLSLFVPGSTYEVEHSDGDYKNVKSAKLIAAASPQAQQPAAAMPAANGNGNGHKDSEQIFVVALLKSLIEAGEVKNDKTQLWATTQMLRQLWRHSFGFDDKVFTPSEAGHRHLQAAE